VFLNPDPTYRTAINVIQPPLLETLRSDRARDHMGGLFPPPAPPHASAWGSNSAAWTVRDDNFRSFADLDDATISSPFWPDERVFHATHMGTGEDNPTLPCRMSALHKSLALEIELRNRSSFQVRYALVTSRTRAGRSHPGRNLLVRDHRPNSGT
jgi:hypothetical protein